MKTVLAVGDGGELDETATIHNINTIKAFELHQIGYSIHPKCNKIEKCVTDIIMEIISINIKLVKSLWNLRKRIRWHGNFL